MSSYPKEAIIDTDFINKITLAPDIDDGKDLFIRTINELNVIPVVHYYVAERELKVKNPIAEELIQSGYLKVFKKEDIVTNQEDEELYADYFKKWYEYLNTDKPFLEKGIDVFTLNRAKHSLGEIHSTLMAYFTGFDIIMSDDSDAKELVRYAGLSSIRVLNLVDVYTDIARKEEKSILLKEVEQVIRCENSDDSIKVKRRKKERFVKVRDVWRAVEMQK